MRALAGNCLRYAALLLRFLQANLLVNLEYRVNFVGAFVMAVLDAGWGVGGAIVLYGHRSSIGGWSFHEAMVVIGLFFIVSGFADAILQPNIRATIEAVRSGEMDYLLTRPVDPMFYNTLRRYRLERLAAVVIGGGLVAYALVQLNHMPAPGQWLVLLALVLAGLSLLYAAMSLIIALCFWAVDLSNIEQLVLGLLETTRYPVQAFPNPVRGFLIFVIPAAFLTTVPAEALLGRLNAETAVYGLAFTVLCLLLARAIWQQAVKSYSSASS